MRKEASQNSEWRKVKRRGRCLKEISKLGSNGKGKRCETHIMQMGVQDKASTQREEKNELVLRGSVKDQHQPIKISRYKGTRLF